MTKTYPPRKHRFFSPAFVLLWSGRFVSNLGDFAFDTVLVLWIATLLKNYPQILPIAVSGVLLIASLTSILSPIIGVYVDRWDKRRTMLVTSASQAFVVFLLMAITFLAAFLPSVLWLIGSIYLTVLLINAAAQFFNPASLVFMTKIVPEEDVSQASALLQVASNTATIFGPIIGSLLFFGLGAQWAILLNAVSFVFSFCATSLIKVEKDEDISNAQQPRQSFRREFGEGFRALFGDTTLTTVTISATLVALGGGAISALDLFFLQNNLHASLELYGLLSTLWGGGLIAGALLAHFLARFIKEKEMFSGSLLGTGICIILYARSTNIIMGMILLFCTGLFMSGANVAVVPLVLKTARKELIGRVVSIMTPLILFASMLSTAGAGVLYSIVFYHLSFTVGAVAFGPIDTIFMGTGLLIFGGGFYAALKLHGKKKSDPQP